MRVVIEREPNPLTSWTWKFWYYEDTHALILDFYCTATRPTKRHKFQVQDAYSRNFPRKSNLKEPDVVLPADVIAEAREKFIEGLRVVRWADRYNRIEEIE